MTDYLVRNPNAFYSAVTLFMIPLDLSAASEQKHFIFTPKGEDPAVGMLSFGGSVILFAGDGQHRVASVREAIRRAPSIAEATLPVVLIPFESIEQVRQLFADLNLNAKPVSKTIGLAYETRDPLCRLGVRGPSGDRHQRPRTGHHPSRRARRTPQLLQTGPLLVRQGAQRILPSSAHVTPPGRRYTPT
jgi:hypothetical protein